MMTIYVTQNFKQLPEDVVKKTIPGDFVILEINEANEAHYAPWLSPFNQDEINHHIKASQDKDIEILYNNCVAYCKFRIATLGVLKLKEKEAPNTKALAMLQWVEDLWTLYYQKKDSILALENVNLSFDEHGELPHTYREAMEEV